MVDTSIVKAQSESIAESSTSDNVGDGHLPNKEPASKRDTQGNTKNGV